MISLLLFINTRDCYVTWNKSNLYGNKAVWCSLSLQYCGYGSDGVCMGGPDVQAGLAQDCYR